MSESTGHRIFTRSVASVYPLYLAKVERKGRTRDELDEAIRWLTGCDQSELVPVLANLDEDRGAGWSTELVTGLVSWHE